MHGASLDRVTDHVVRDAHEGGSLRPARLPYPMLAEELLSVARREWWLADRGAFDGGLADNCLGVRLLCRLAALHEDPEYVESAVVAGETTYAADARRVLDAVEDDPRL